LVLADRAGVVRLYYGGLLAYDDEQQSLPAWFEVRGEEVLVRVDDNNAAYPLTIDPWLQATKLTTSQGADYDYLGGSMAVSADGSTVIVGAEASSGSAPGASALYVYTRGESWVSTPLYTARLRADGAEHYYTSVAVSADGSVVVAGTYGEDGDNSAVYVFVRPSDGWRDATQTATLTASDAEDYDILGSSVALSADGGTLAAGTPTDDDFALRPGAVYLYERPMAGWVDAIETAKLIASDGQDGDNLGRSVALSADGSTLAAGAPDNDAGGENRGAIYVYVRLAGGWTTAKESAKLTASDGQRDDGLGYSVTLSADGGTLAAGAIGKDSRLGSVYLYERPANGWATTKEVAILTASDGADGDRLGISVALNADGDILAAGAPGYDAGGDDHGAVFVYQRQEGSWISTSDYNARLTGSDSENNDWLGISIALSADGGTLVTGTRYHDAGGINRGAAYLYERPPDGWITSVEDAKLTACDAEDDDNLGRSAGIDSSGTTLVAGAPYNDAGGTDRGAAYIYQRPITGWQGNTIFTAKLTAGDGEDEDYLGWSVALSADGDTLAVGAPYEDGAGSNRGAVYVYERPTGGWITTAAGIKLTASDAGDGDNLGRSVAISDDGGVIITGAPYYDAGGDNRGTTYVFVRPVGGWMTTIDSAKLIASDGEGGDQFGWSVALSGDG
jgi:hypothetical protein